MGSVNVNTNSNDYILTSYKCPFEVEKVKIQLKANKWCFRKQKVDTDIPSDAIIYVSPDTENEENYKAYILSNIICVRHEKDKIIFKAKKKPCIDINVMLCFLRVN
jgi:hypothetical protein